MLIHNHTNEFEPLADGGGETPFEVLMASTDPSLVVFQLDIGWSTVAGQDAVQLFEKYPGRFPLWHVKDMADLASVRGLRTQAERQRAARIVAVGEGEIDYRPIFAKAKLAGLEHFVIEDDAATQQPQGSLAVARTCITNLKRALG